jgi:predicted nucleic acid-binding protein
MPSLLPALIATDLCIDLARGVPEALTFFETPPVEIRLSTATYLELLGLARSPAEQRRLRRFVAPYAVLSLGPMASSRAVDLLLAYHLTDGLQPLQALMAATALAHEIPLYTRNPGPFHSIPELEVVSPY